MGQRLPILAAVVAVLASAAPASARLPVGETTASVVTFRPAEVDRWRAVQDAVLDGLPGPRPLVRAQLATGNIALADLTAAQRDLLAARPEVAAVAVDSPVPITPPTSDPADPGVFADPPASPAAPTPLPPVDVPPAACSGTEDSPQLEPEALGTLNVRSDDPTVPTAAGLGYDGAEVKIGIVSTAMDPTMPDFQRLDGSPAVVDYRSYTSGGLADAGSAAEGFGDVSSIVAQGRVAHDLATVVNAAAATLPGGHCWIRIVGVAPAADVFYANVNDAGELAPGAVVQAIDDAVAADVDILSESFGGAQIPDASVRTAIEAANLAAVDAGVTVVVSSGDAGPNSTIGSPAAGPGVISVGASITGRLAVQSGTLGVTRFGDGSWPDGTAAALSSSGFTTDGRTIDIVAPGDAGWSICSADPRFTDCRAIGNGSATADVIEFAGTSQSAPFVAGVAALVVQAYRETHGGLAPTPDQVERILTGTAGDLGLPADVQGSGLVDAFGAVLAARALDAPGVGTPVAGPTADRSLIADTTQLTLGGRTDQGVQVQVTNTGTSARPLQPLVVTRDEQVGRQTFAVDFDLSAPPFVDGTGASLVSTRQPFAVTPGAAAVNIQVAGVPVNPGQTKFGVQVVVLDPSGVPAAYARGKDGLQVQVPDPVAGEWTAVVQAGVAEPFSGELAVERSERRVIATARADVPVLAPGASTTIRAGVPMPTEPGDAAATLRVADQLTLPVLQRVPVSFSTEPVTVTTAVRPQNGRSGVPAQQAVWEFDVPAGRRSLDVSATLGDPAEAVLSGVLVGPDGLARSITSNVSGNDVEPSIDQSVTDPTPGRWRFVLALWNTVWSVPATRAQAQVQFAVDRQVASADGLPAGDRLIAGSSRTVTLNLDNPGPTTLQVVVDPRTAARTEIELAPVGTASVEFPLTASSITALPKFVVPPFSTRLTLSAQSTVPLILGARSPFGAVLALSPFGTAGGPSPSPRPTVVVEDAGRSPGPWGTEATQPGPRSGVAPAGRAEISARVETAAYDTAVTDAAGQPFVTATGPASDVQPTTVAPGGRLSVPVTLFVRGAPGDRVRGFLALTTRQPDTAAELASQSTTRSGDVLAVFPYEYTVAEPEPTTTTAPPTTDQSTTSPTTPSSTPSPDTSTPPAPSTTSGGSAVIVAPVTVLPITPTWAVPLAPAPLDPAGVTQPVFAASGPTGALPTTGLNLLPWLVSAGLSLTLGLGLLALARRSRRPRSH